jgi:GNAT superfamily N-acetyltransferase
MSSPADRIREYHDTDAAALRDCIIELQDFERVLDNRLRPGVAMADDYLQHIHDRCRACAGTILVAEVAGRVAGFVTILTSVPFESLDDPPGDFALVADLVVRERFRRRGVGGTLLRAAEALARRGGAVELRVSVMAGNSGAAALYGRHGFAPYLETLSKRLT